MKRINRNEYKKVLVQILEYFDKICRENNVNYSLIGGSLIGAIRHKGIIPWDDDIDVILTRDNYDKIISILKKDNNSNFKLLSNDICNDYHLPFPKLVATNTFVVEPLMLKQIKDYGIFIDIFCYNYLPNDEKERIKTVKRIKFLNGIIAKKKMNFKNTTIFRNFLGFIRNIISIVIGSKKLISIINNIYEKNRDLNSNYIISNWPIYADDKEIQLSKNTKDYINTTFENLTVMIFKNYDEILKTTFGDYMKLPPKDKRVCHGIEAYWRNEQNEK